MPPLMIARHDIQDATPVTRYRIPLDGRLDTVAILQWLWRTTSDWASPAIAPRNQQCRVALSPLGPEWDGYRGLPPSFLPIELAQLLLCILSTGILRHSCDIRP